MTGRGSLRGLVAIAIAVGGCSSAAPRAGSDGGAGTGGGAGAGASCWGAGADVDVRATVVSGSVTVNGAALPDASRGLGVLSLRTAAGDEARIGPTLGSYSTLVVPGTYDLYYSVNSAGPAVPSNAAAKLRAGILVGTSPLALDVDVPAATVSGTVTVNGAPVTDSRLRAFLTLVGATGDKARLTGTSLAGGAYAALVVPGTYDLYYSSGGDDGSVIPANSAALLQSGIVVGTSPLSLNVDVPATNVSATLTFQGAALTGFNVAAISLRLRNAAGDALPLVRSVTTGVYSAFVVPGTYDLYYEGARAEADVPRHSAAKVQTGIVVGSDPVSLSVDVPATHVTGRITVNGAVVAGLATGSVLSLNTPSGDEVTLPAGSDGTYDALVVPGTYDLHYRKYLGGASTVPSNESARLRTGIVVGSAPLTLDIDVPATPLSGTVTVNGVAVTDQSKGQGILRLASATGNKVPSLTMLDAGSYATLVIPDTYDLIYDMYRPGPAVPFNLSAKVKSGIVVGASPVVLDIDVPAVPVTTHMTINGGTILDDALGEATLNAVSAAGGDATVAITLPSDLPYHPLVIPGAYDLYYRQFNVGSAVPSNASALLGCFNVP